MATIKIPKSIPPIHLDRFLGINTTPDGEIGLQLGEAVYMRNWRVTSNYKLKKVEGYKSLITRLTGKVQGAWYGKLNNINFFLFCNNGHLYSYDLTASPTSTVLSDLITANVVKDLGTLTDAPTSFIPFGTKVYLNNGHEYKSFNGVIATPSTDSLVTVAGYRPLVAIGTPPTGGGTSYEQINVLTGKKRQSFRSDGTHTKYIIAEANVGSIDYVEYLGATLTKDTDYTVNLTEGSITTVTQKPNWTGADDDLEIGWTKGTGERDLIEGCRFSMDYSGQTDSRVFLWGNTTCKNRRFWSGLADGVPSAEYFEALSFDDLGNGQYSITDIVKMGDIQKIYFENGAMYSYYATETIGDQTVANFPAFELSDEIGNVAFNQVQIVQDKPLTLFNGIYAWENTNVRYQLIHSLISQRVQDSLNSIDLSTAITFNWQKMKEYWINVGSVVWVYNYLNNTWYEFDDIQATCFIEINGELYFGTNGTIEKFDTTSRTHNGNIYTAKWEMGFNAFNEEWLTKFMNNEYVGLYPEIRSRVDVSIITDNEGLIDAQSIYYNLAVYDHVNYAHWSYSTSYNPQPKKVEIQANRFVYIKIVLENSSDRETATILSITLPARLGGKI